MITVFYLVLVLSALVGTVCSLFFVYRLWKATRVKGFAIFLALLVLTVVGILVTYIPGVRGAMVAVGLSFLGPVISIFAASLGAVLTAIAWKSIYSWHQLVESTQERS